MAKKLPSPAEMKAAVEAFKKQFTPDFVHFSPSNNIKSFDPSKAKKDKDFTTPNVSFVAPMSNAKWANDNFLPVAGDVGQKEMYKTGATGYPVSVNLGKHFNVETPEGQQLINDFAVKFQNQKMTPEARKELDSIVPGYADHVLQESIAKHVEDLGTGNYTHLELPEFLQHLQETGHDTFKVNESSHFGKGNIGIFDPKNIRGKFAKYNPEDADSPDFMKAEGGAVEGYAPGGKVGALSELMQLIKQQGGSAAAKRLERAADLIPNLEHKIQPQGLKSAFTADNASAVMVMRPGDFEKYAMPIGKETLDRKNYRIGDVYAGNHEQLPKGDLDEYLNYLNSVKESGGFRDVPFLNVGQREGHSFPNIQGHEGRHRMRALEKAGEEYGLVRMIPTSNLRESLPRSSQEEYLDALQNKIGIKPMVTPEQTEEGVSRGLIDLPQMFATGGNVAKAAKKALEHARQVKFVHYSNKPDLTELDPRFYGTGIKGAEAARLKNAPDIKPRSYIYTDRPDVRPEQGLGSHKYSGVAEDMYPLHEDPAGYSAIAKTKAIDPYMMQFGREVIDQPTHLNELERLIKAAGYKGYANDDVGLLFHPTNVQKVTD